MKVLILVLTALILFSGCTTVPSVHSENRIKSYMESNNQTYPINIDTSLEKSFYRDYSLEEDLKLTAEQRMKLERFIKIFLSDNKYIEQLKESSKTDTFSINNFIIEHASWGDNIALPIMFYSKNKMGDIWLLDEKNNIWWAFNIAYYNFSNDNIELMGWGI